MSGIRWDEPLETDEATPRSAVATPRSFNVTVDGSSIIYQSDGTPASQAWGWPRLRNVRPVRTADEALQRMEALVRRMAGADDVTAMTVEAREIVALLPEPVDPDLGEVLALAAERAHCVSFTYDDIVTTALAGIKRGRELAARGE